VADLLVTCSQTGLWAIGSLTRKSVSQFPAQNIRFQSSTKQESLWNLATEKLLREPWYKNRVGLRIRVQPFPSTYKVRQFPNRLTFGESLQSKSQNLGRDRGLEPKAGRWHPGKLRAPGRGKPFPKGGKQADSPGGKLGHRRF